MTHLLDDARAQMREGHTSAQWELIAREKVMRTLLETGEFTADVLADLNIPVEYRKHVHGAATGYFSGAEPFMDEAGRRKSERPSRKGGKNTLFVISAKGRRELPKLLRDLQRELPQLNRNVGHDTREDGDSGDSSDALGVVSGELTPASVHPEAPSVTSPPPAVEVATDAGSPDTLIQLDGARKAPSMYDAWEGEAA